jgi:hypothetical protein
VRGATLYTGPLGTFAVNGVLLTADNYDEMTDGFAIASTTGGGGGGGSTAWADVTGKPFTSIGTGLTVTDGALSADGAAPAWGLVTGKPFEALTEDFTVTAGQLHVNDALLEGKLDAQKSYGTTTSAYSHASDGGGYRFATSTEANFVGADAGTGIFMYSKNPADNVGSRVIVTPAAAYVLSNTTQSTPAAGYEIPTKHYVDSAVAAGGGGGGSTAWGDVTGKPFSTVGGDFSVNSGELAASGKIARLDRQQVYAFPQTFSSDVFANYGISAGNSSYAIFPNTVRIGDRTKTGNNVEIYNVDSLTASPTHVIDSDNDFATKKYVDDAVAGGGGGGGTPSWGDVTGKPFEAVGTGLSVGSDKKLNANAQGWNDITGKPFTGVGANLAVTGNNLTTGSTIPLKAAANDFTGINTFTQVSASQTAIFSGNFSITSSPDKLVTIRNVDELEATATYRPIDAVDFTTKKYVDSVSAGAGVAPAWSAVTGKPFEAVGTGLSVGSDKKLNANAQAWGDITGKPFTGVGANLAVTGGNLTTGDNVALKDGGNTWTGSNSFSGLYAGGSTVITGNIVLRPDAGKRVEITNVDTLRATADHKIVDGLDFTTKAYVDSVSAGAGVAPAWSAVTGKPFESLGDNLTVGTDKKLTVEGVALEDGRNVFTGMNEWNGNSMFREQSTLQVGGNFVVGHVGGNYRLIELYNVDSLTASPTHVVDDPYDFTTKSYVDAAIAGAGTGDVTVQQLSDTASSVRTYADNLMWHKPFYSMSTLTPVDTIHDGDTVVFPLAQFGKYNPALKDASVSWRIRFGIYNGKIHYNNFNRSVHEVYEVEGGSMTGDWNWMYPAKYVGGWHPNSGTPKLLGVYQHAAGDPVYAIYQWYGNQQYPENNLSQPIMAVEDVDYFIHTNGGKNTSPDGITYFNNQPLETLKGLLSKYHGEHWCTGGVGAQAAVLRWFEPVQEAHPMLAYTTNPNGQTQAENGIVYARLGSWSPYDPTTNNSVNLALDFSLIPSQTHTGTYFQREDYRIYISHNNTDWGAKYASVYYVGSSGSAPAVDSIYLVKSPAAATYDIWVGYYSHYRSQPIAIVTGFDQLVTPNPNGHRINRNTFESAKLEPVVKVDSVLKRAYGGDTTLVAFELKDFAGDGNYAKLAGENTFTGNNTFQGELEAGVVGIERELYVSGNTTLDGKIQLATNQMQDVFANAPVVMYPGYLTGTPHPKGWGSVDNSKNNVGDVEIPLPTEWHSYGTLPSNIDVNTIIGGRSLYWAVGANGDSVYTSEDGLEWVLAIETPNVLRMRPQRCDTVAFTSNGIAYILFGRNGFDIVDKPAGVSGVCLDAYYHKDNNTLYGAYYNSTTDSLYVTYATPDASSTRTVWSSFDAPGTTAFDQGASINVFDTGVLKILMKSFPQGTAYESWRRIQGMWSKVQTSGGGDAYAVECPNLVRVRGRASNSDNGLYYNSFLNPSSMFAPVYRNSNNGTLQYINGPSGMKSVIAYFGNQTIAVNSALSNRVGLYDMPFGNPIDEVIVSSVGLKYVATLSTDEMIVIDNNNAVYKPGAYVPPPDPPIPPDPPGIINTSKPYVQTVPNQYVATVGYADNWQTATRTIRIPHVDNTSKNTVVSHGAHFASWQGGWDVWAQYWIPDSTLIYCYPNDDYEVKDWIVNGVSTGQTGNTILVAIHNDATIRPVVGMKDPHTYGVAVSPPSGGTISYVGGGTSKVEPRWYHAYFNVSLASGREINKWMCNGFDVSMLVQDIQQPYDYIFDTDGDCTLTLVTDIAPVYHFTTAASPAGYADPTVNGGSSADITTNTDAVLKANVKDGYVFSHWELNGGRIDGDANTTYFVNEDWSPHGGEFKAVCLETDNYILLRWGNEVAKNNFEVFIDDDEIPLDGSLLNDGYVISRNPNHRVRLAYKADERSDYYPQRVQVGGEEFQAGAIPVSNIYFNTNNTNISYNGVIISYEALQNTGLGPNTFRRAKVYVKNTCRCWKDGVCQDDCKQWYTTLNLNYQYNVGDWLDFSKLAWNVDSYVNDVYMPYDTRDSEYILHFHSDGGPKELFADYGSQVYMDGNQCFTNINYFPNDRDIKDRVTPPIAPYVVILFTVEEKQVTK